MVDSPTALNDKSDGTLIYRLALSGVNHGRRLPPYLDRIRMVAAKRSARELVEEIRVEKIAALGEAHYGRKAMQPSGQEVNNFYAKAEPALKHSLLTLSEDDVTIVSSSFAKTIESKKYTCYACAIMPDHVHLLIRKHRDHAEDMIEHLRTKSREALIHAGLRNAEHPVWADGNGFKVFLRTQQDIERTIAYIRNNPLKEGLPEQRWPFVKVYDGWMPGCWKAR